MSSDLVDAQAAAQIAGVSLAVWHRLHASGLTPDVAESDPPQWRRRDLRAWLSAWVSSGQSAQLAGVGRSTWTAYVARGQAPRPDVNPGRKSLWRRKTVLTWIGQRPGPGARRDLQA